MVVNDINNLPFTVYKLISAKLNNLEYYLNYSTQNHLQSVMEQARTIYSLWTINRLFRRYQADPTCGTSYAREVLVYS